MYRYRNDYKHNEQPGHDLGEAAMSLENSANALHGTLTTLGGLVAQDAISNVERDVIADIHKEASALVSKLATLAGRLNASYDRFFTAFPPAAPETETEVAS